MAPNTTAQRPTISFDEDDDDNSHNVTIESSLLSSSHPETTKTKNGLDEKQQKEKQSSSLHVASRRTVTTTPKNDGSVIDPTVVGIVVVVVVVAAAIGYSVLVQQPYISFDSLLLVIKKTLPMIGISLGRLLMYFFVVSNTIWLLSMILSIGYDDIYTTIINTVWRQSDTKKPVDRTVAQRPVSIGYNKQIQLLAGIIMYSIALLTLLYSEAQDNKTSFVQQNGTWFENNATIISRVFGTEYKSLLIHVIGIIGVYTIFEYEWMPFIATHGNFRERTLHGLQWLEKAALVRIALLLAFIVQDPFDLGTVYNIDSSIVYNTIRTILYGWIVFKLIDFTYHYYTNHRTIRTSEYPKEYEDTVLTKKRNLIEKNGNDNTMIDYTTTQLGTNESKDVWNIYGNQYDVSAFVPYHPGGVESIMLAANRDDATALFQSYHPFNIKKARTVLEKYRINTTYGIIYPIMNKNRF